MNQASKTTRWAGPWTPERTMLCVALFALCAASASAQTALAPPASAASTAARPALQGEAIAHTCAACHGTQGRLGDEAFMPLAGLPAEQMLRTMQAFRSGQRPGTLMGLVARGLSDADLQAMADYFARQTPQPGSAAALMPIRQEPAR
jgi:sulfide dehydrogenase cytochrome subunit